MSAFGGETDIKTKLLTKDEARRIAPNIAKLPDPLGSRRAMKPPKEKKMQKWEYNLLVQSPNTECARCEEALNGLGRDWLGKLIGSRY
jgi:hypothetical protein